MKSIYKLVATLVATAIVVACDDQGAQSPQNSTSEPARRVDRKRRYGLRITERVVVGGAGRRPLTSLAAPEFPSRRGKSPVTVAGRFRVVNHGAPKFARRGGWLPTDACSGRIVTDVVIDFYEAKKRLRPKERVWGPPPIQKTLALADAFQCRIEAGEVTRPSQYSSSSTERARAH